MTNQTQAQTTRNSKRIFRARRIFRVFSDGNYMQVSDMELKGDYLVLDFELEIDKDFFFDIAVLYCPSCDNEKCCYEINHYFGGFEAFVTFALRSKEIIETEIERGRSGARDPLEFLDLMLKCVESKH